MRSLRPWLLLGWILAGLGSGCQPEPARLKPAAQAAALASAPSNTPPAGLAATNRQTFEVKGVINEVQLERKKAKITHEAIPGYMEAMTMLLDVRDAKELVGLHPGDHIRFRMVVTDDDGWIEDVRKLDEPRTPLPPEPPVRRVRYVEALALGDEVPDYAFTNMLGSVIRLRELRGRAVAFTFIFTRCPFPTFCPRLSTSFQQAHDRLKATPDSPTNWMLLSITMDTEYDTPARLFEYAQRYHADPKHWLYVTGDLTDITAIGEQFGLQFWRPKPGDPISHNVRTVVIDTRGRVQWISNENEFKPDELAAQIAKAAAVSPNP